MDHAPDPMNSDDATARLLRRLALMANGLSGADVERLVRLGRQRARRERRALSWRDLETLLAQSRPRKPQSEEGLMRKLVVLLAGRAAEEAVIGSALAGSGNGEESDLARATDAAAQMELSFGYGRAWPLLHRPASDRSALLCYQPRIAEQVNARLEEAYGRALRLMEANRDALEPIAEALLACDTLEGEDLEALVAAIAPNLAVPDAEPCA